MKWNEMYWIALEQILVSESVNSELWKCVNFILFVQALLLVFLVKSSPTCIIVLFLSHSFLWNVLINYNQSDNEGNAQFSSFYIAIQHIYMKKNCACCRNHSDANFVFVWAYFQNSNAMSLMLIATELCVYSSGKKRIYLLSWLVKSS